MMLHLLVTYLVLAHLREGCCCFLLRIELLVFFPTWYSGRVPLNKHVICLCINKPCISLQASTMGEGSLDKPTNILNKDLDMTLGGCNAN